MKSETKDTKEPPCDNVRRLAGTALLERHRQLKDGWKLIGEEQLQKEFKFPDFRTALEFTNLVGAAAEALNHHPDIYLTYGMVRLQISSHEAAGLTDCDFKLATRVNELKHAS